MRLPACRPAYLVTKIRSCARPPFRDRPLIWTYICRRRRRRRMLILYIPDRTQRPDRAMDSSTGTMSVWPGWVRTGRVVGVSVPPCPLHHRHWWPHRFDQHLTLQRTAHFPLRFDALRLSTLTRLDVLDTSSSRLASPQRNFQFTFLTSPSSKFPPRSLNASNVTLNSSCPRPSHMSTTLTNVLNRGGEPGACGPT